MPSILPTELAVRLARGEAVVIVDVRTAREYIGGHVPGAVNVPFTEIGARVSEITARCGDEIVVYCGHGPRAWIAGAWLRRRGFRRILYLRGHWAGWRRARLPVET